MTADTPTSDDHAQRLKWALDRFPEYRTTHENVMAEEIVRLRAEIARLRDAEILLRFDAGLTATEAVDDR